MARGQLHLGSQSESSGDVVAEALAAFGLCCDEDVVVEDDEYWLWPENEKAFHLWCALQTQWTVGMSGVIGLNYSGVESCMRMCGIAKKKQTRLFSLVQAMERAVLEEWAAKR